MQICTGQVSFYKMKKQKRRGAPKGSQNHAGRGPVQTGKRPAKGKYSKRGVIWMEDDPTGYEFDERLKQHNMSINDCIRKLMSLNEEFFDVLMHFGELDDFTGDNQ